MQNKNWFVVRSITWLNLIGSSSLNDLDKENLNGLLKATYNLIEKKMERGEMGRKNSNNTPALIIIVVANVIHPKDWV